MLGGLDRNDEKRRLTEANTSAPEATVSVSPQASGVATVDLEVKKPVRAVAMVGATIAVREHIQVTFTGLTSAYPQITAMEVLVGVRWALKTTLVATDSRSTTLGMMTTEQLSDDPILFNVRRHRRWPQLGTRAIQPHVLGEPLLQRWLRKRKGGPAGTGSARQHHQARRRAVTGWYVTVSENRPWS